MEIKTLLFSAIIVFLLVISNAFAAVDATVTQLSITPATVNPGIVATVSITVKNLGDETASNVLVQFKALNGSLETAQDSTTISLSPDETQTETFSWTPSGAANYTIKASATIAADVNNSNDELETSVNVADKYEITSFSVSPSTIYINANGIANQALVINGFMKQNNAGTSDQIFIYIDNNLRDFVLSNSTNSGYFASTLSNLYFESTGMHSVRADAIRSNAVIASASTQINVSSSTSSQGSTGALVDLSISPSSLEVYPRDLKKYTLSIKNIGNVTDTYTFSIATNTDIRPWLNLDRTTTTLNAGESASISLWVDVPENLTFSGNFSVTVTAQGAAMDSERANLVVFETPGSSSSGIFGFDLEIGKPSITPSIAYLTTDDTVYITAPISFLDLRLVDGQPVTVKLYVNRILAKTKVISFVTGDTKDVEFELGLDEFPINGKAGTYDLYYYAEVYDEVDKSSTTTLTVKEGQSSSFLTLLTTSINTSVGGNFTFDIKLTNNGEDALTYAIYATGLPVTLSPTTLAINPKETKIFTINAALGNASVGNYTMRVFAENADTKNYASMKVYVTEKEAEAPSGISGFITLVRTDGSTIAGVLGILALILLIGYYLYSKGSFEGGRPSASAILTEPEQGEKKEKTEDKLNLEKLVLARQLPTAKSQEPVKEWSAKDAEHVLENLDVIKEDFSAHLGRAKEIRSTLNEITPGVEKKVIKTSATPKKEAEEHKPKTHAEIKGSDEYIKSVARSI